MLERIGVLGNREGRLRVRERSWSWLASRICVRDWGPWALKRERSEAAMEEADGEESDVDAEQRRIHTEKARREGRGN